MSFRVKAQQFGSKLSGMVIPNLGAFMAWGIITAVAIAIDSSTLKEFIGPMLNYLLPLLIAFAGGKAVHDYRGGVIATVATMGAILGSDVTMFIGAMILGPLSAWILKQFDKVIDGKIPTGFELLVNNFSVGIFGAILAWLGYIGIAPFVSFLTNILSAGVDVLVKYSLLPLTAIFIEPAKVLFLNNAIGQGILSPLGSTQLTEYGKSVLYLLESNPGPGLGILLAYMIAGKGNSKASAYGSGVIHFFGGIHEIYFPFVLMNPVLVLPLILGGITGTFLFTFFDVGLIGVASPGSILAILMMSASGDYLQILISVLASAAVSCLVAVPFVKRAKNNDSELKEAAAKMEQLKGKKSSISSVFTASDAQTVDYSTVSKIAYACDAGLGSSAMGANILQKKIKKAGIDDISVFHISISNLPAEADIIVTHQSLVERVAEKQPNTHCIAITDYLNDPEYGTLVTKLVDTKKKTG
ncbi:PTS mannitol transporter subunit IICB [Neobacillus sp. NPDC097160]|uniref:PTS mannitol transporter subunit IICB n=1 Tax=Neobacillus sp. NPDC097160 TaxID=3364298 RepID=UPI003811F1D3